MFSCWPHSSHTSARKWFNRNAYAFRSSSKFYNKKNASSGANATIRFVYLAKTPRIVCLVLDLRILVVVTYFLFFCLSIYNRAERAIEIVSWLWIHFNHTQHTTGMIQITHFAVCMTQELPVESNRLRTAVHKGMAPLNNYSDRSCNLTKQRFLKYGRHVH